MGEPMSAARRRAIALSRDENRVEGPIEGHHHETYVIPLPPEVAGALGVDGTVRWKCREPKPGLLWFDRRCFASEERLIGELRGRVGGVPEIVEVEGVPLQRFVEGVTLGARYGREGWLPWEVVGQLLRLFGELVAIRPADLDLERNCRPADRPRDGDTAGFLRGLIRFVETRVYLDNESEYGDLFEALGVKDGSLRRLREDAEGLRKRPFCLLHGDLHRENLVLDAHRTLWTIDWELAIAGDPLYDLATHLHLAGYPDRQAVVVARNWAHRVERARPGASRGWRQDLRLLLAFKEAQSVFTDIIRTALTVRGPDPDTGSDTGSGAERARLAEAAGRLHRVVLRGAGPLGLGSVPEPWQIADALQAWSKRRSQPGSSAT
ncbi:phosphotransferase [Streptomyces sp. NPDC049887]|uniref:phosphotransferase n=1 Tax=Streptomyces sp. NPDC049887 TaxID=3155654 RepID=UPI0034332446